MSRYYDERGTRIPASRTDDKKPSAMGVLSFALIMVLLCICTYLSIKVSSQANEIESMRVASEEEERVQKLNQTVSMDAMCGIHTNSGDVIRLYVMTDPDDGTEYVVSDKGGICVRVKSTDYVEE